ncbi:hypothetical protein UFOVP118_38 [uncultured Caudovirales phage]|uniref:Uncharacterized protein n=1 Tax=uncultured Caudovirales phage TaxID=2100421 RepID=A0A6J5L3U0_9CAUD|nr:hypothetical protein UFOVP118_38 [uncultured Caudovirales phage]
MKILITEIEVFAVSPRLSDEDTDPMERDDNKESTYFLALDEGWLPWSAEDMLDVRKIIAKLEPKDQFIMEAFLDGLNYSDVSVTEKYWRYHFAKGIEIIRKELDI